MRIVALLAVYNERRFIEKCIQHLVAQGVEVYLIDNCSSDRTVELANRYLDRGVIGIETLPRNGCFELTQQLRRKEQLAAQLDADWFMHTDADSFYSAGSYFGTLKEAITEIDALGYNAINFHEYTFVPTRESSNHDHADFMQTMQWYYPFLPQFPHRINAWKKQSQPVELTESAGHCVKFPGLILYPKSLVLRHYIFLSREHALEKYASISAREVAQGWFYPRANLRPEMIKFPGAKRLRRYKSDCEMDAGKPWTRHFWADDYDKASRKGVLTTLRRKQIF